MRGGWRNRGNPVSPPFRRRFIPVPSGCALGDGALPFPAPAVGEVNHGLRPLAQGIVDGLLRA
jgi:hypothetical protein